MATTAIVDVALAAQANFKGFNNITMTNWTSATLKPLIAIGSTFELGGAIYQTATADEDPDPAAAWAGLAAGLVYLYATAAAGTITFSVSVTAPTWDTAKQGYYNGAARCLGQFYKSGGNWTQKIIYKGRDYGENYQGLCIGIGAASDRYFRTSQFSYIKWDNAGQYHVIPILDDTNLESNIELNTGSTIVSVSGGATTAFTLKKPLTYYVIFTAGGISTNTLEIYQNSGWRTVETYTTGGAGTTYYYALHLNPGQYRVVTDANGLIQIKATAIYGSTAFADGW